MGAGGEVARGRSLWCLVQPGSARGRPPASGGGLQPVHGRHRLVVCAVAGRPAPLGVGRSVVWPMVDRLKPATGCRGHARAVGGGQAEARSRNRGSVVPGLRPGPVGVWRRARCAPMVDRLRPATGVRRPGRAPSTCPSGHRRSAGPARSPRRAFARRVSRCRRESLPIHGSVDTAANTTELRPLAIDSLLETTVEMSASDLHVTSGSHPAIRRHGHIELLTEFPILTPDLTRELIYRITTTEQQKNLEVQAPARLRLRDPRARPLPCQRLLPARVARRRVPHDPRRDQVARGARAAPRAPRVHDEAARPRALHRARRAPASRPRSRR